MVALIVGIVVVLAGVIGLGWWWDLFVKGLKASVPIMLVLGGIIAIAAGISDIRDRMEEKREKEKEAKEKKEQPQAPAEKKEA